MPARAGGDRASGVQRDRPKVGLILAAGASTRMGRDKASLPWGDTTLLAYQASQQQAAGLSPVAVVRGLQQATIPLPAGVTIACNPQPERGKVSSILTGLAALPLEFATLALVAVDQPRPAWLYAALLEAQRATGAPLVAPQQGDRLGHPLLIAGSLRTELLQLNEATQGLRQLVRQYRSALLAVPLATPLVCCDLNTPEEYQAWRDRPALFFGDREVSRRGDRPHI